MIKVDIFQHTDGTYQRILCHGHAGFANYGKDIICSAVSILVINTINSLEELTGETMEVEADENSGLIDCKFTEAVSEKGNLLIDSMILGLRNIVKSYGKKYLEVTIKEV